MKNILKILVPLIVLGLGSCTSKYNDVHKIGEYNGYKVSAWTVAEKPNISIEGKDFESPSITAQSKYDSKRFDEILLWGVPDGHDIEKYASLDSLQKIYDYIIENGEDRFKIKNENNK